MSSLVNFLNTPPLREGPGVGLTPSFRKGTGVGSGVGLILLCLLLLLSACGPLAPTPAESAPTEAATLTPTPTPTIVWFPATNTPTLRPPGPTPQPTPEMLPALGSILLEDDFSDSAPWQTGRSTKGVVSISSQSINLAVQAGYGALQSLRSQPSPADFYAEIDVHFNLCSSQDLAGMIFNALDSGNMYRALIRCDGQVSVEHVSNYNYGYVKKWTPGIGFGAGALQKVRLGVWQANGEVRIFVNDVYQFSLQLPQNSTGMVGVFARAGGSDPVTMTFSDLLIRTVDPAAVPTRTPLP